MPGCDTSEDRKTSLCVRSARDIKAALLRQAFDGQSKRSSSELIRMIQDAHSRASFMPEEHLRLLSLIDRTQPRSVMMLNALADLLGLTTRYAAIAGRNFIMPENSTIQ